MLRVACSRARSKLCSGSHALPTTFQSRSRPAQSTLGLRASSEVAYLTNTEREKASLIDAVRTKSELYNQLLKQHDQSGQSAVDSGKLLKDLAPVASLWEKYRQARKSIHELEPLLSDPDASMRELSQDEHNALCDELDQIVGRDLPSAILAPLDTDHLPAVVSINAGVGGAEAALFVEELARMYARYGEQQGWRSQVISEADGSGGKGGNGLRETTIKFEDPQERVCFGRLRWEAGVHRVQRVPLTETLGRVHTSTAAVIVMPLYPDTGSSPILEAKDVKTEVMRSRGAGGQHVNKTESAVRLTHIPTGITVSMQDSRSQHQNRAWAWDILRARLSERKHAMAVESKRASRRSQVKGADRSEKIRTYNFPQDRLTDHRIGYSLSGLQSILDGVDLQLVIKALEDDFASRRLQSICDGDDDLDE